MPLATPQRASLVDQVIGQLSAQVSSGEWPVGSRIPTEAELVAALGVGRNTVREAVRALVHAGVLESRQGAGTFVRADSEVTGLVRRRLAAARQRDVVEVRRALEVEAARLAAERRTAADLARLDDALARRAAAWAGRDVEAFVAADTAFHEAVAAAARNPVLAELYANLSAVLRDSVRALSAELTTQPVDHADLVRAIRDRDAAAAMREAGTVLAERLRGE